jgi:hypothetical protein
VTEPKTATGHTLNQAWVNVQNSPLRRSAPELFSGSGGTISRLPRSPAQWTQAVSRWRPFVSLPVLSHRSAACCQATPRCVKQPKPRHTPPSPATPRLTEPCHATPSHAVLSHRSAPSREGTPRCVSSPSLAGPSHTSPRLASPRPTSPSLTKPRQTMRCFRTGVPPVAKRHPAALSSPCLARPNRAAPDLTLPNRAGPRQASIRCFRTGVCPLAKTHPAA